MRKMLLIVLVVVLTAVCSYAGHVDTYGIGSRATAMGGAMTAGVNDGFAVYYNPAAMTRIKQKTLSIGSHFVDPSLEIENFDAEVTTASPYISDSETGTGIKDESPLLIVPHMSYVQPLTDRIFLGVALYVPYGLELTWNSDTTTNPGAYNAYKSWYIREVITPSIAVKATDKLSVGFGISIGKSEAGTHRVRYVPDFMTSSSTFQAFGYDAATSAYLAAAYSDLEGSSYKTEVEDPVNYSFNIGLLYELNEKLSFGITYRSKSVTRMTGSTDVSPDATYWTNQNVGASVGLDTPDQVQVGVEYKPTKKLSLNFDVTRTWWGSIDSYTVEFEENFMATTNLSAGAEEETYQRDWENTWVYRVGAEYQLTDMVALRAGYYHDPSVVPAETFDIQWPDSDKHVYSVGLGLTFERVNVDFVLQYITIDDITIDGESENLNDTFTRTGVHDGEVDAKASGSLMGYGVTVSYKF